MAPSPEILGGVTAQTEADSAAFSIEQFLAVEQQKDLLRFSTAGSVDDGKSTLIGRLLYDSRNVYEDHVRSVTRTHGGHSRPAIDFAQLTDGLRAEREQGITIDVAYRYFSTERRKFIIADTPGHEQYTRNMATGASTADVAIILIDARKGILVQSRRHAYIASLLGIRHLVAAINKMDLVGFSAGIFARIQEDFGALVRRLGDADLQVIPISALLGDNVVEPSVHMPWYTGPTLLDYLETVPATQQADAFGFRLPVQRVIRPHQHFRGFAGQIAAGSVQPGDRVIALPSGRTTRIASITTFDGDLDQASAPRSVVVTLQDEFDISRGDWIASADSPPESGSALEASLVWFDGRPLDRARNYLLKHAAETVSARVTAIRHRMNIETMGQENADRLEMNDIGLVEIKTLRPVFFDPYQQNRATGSFILIDVESNATAAAGMFHRALLLQKDGPEQDGKKIPLANSHRGLPQNAQPVEPLWGHQPAILVVHDAALACDLEDSLLAAGCAVVRTRLYAPEVWRALLQAGVIAIVESPAEREEKRGILIGTVSTPAADLRLEPLLPAAAEETATTAVSILDALERENILPSEKRGNQA